MTPDICIQSEGSIFLFHPLTPTAKEWITEFVQDDTQFFGQALVVEHRYARDVAQGMIDDGLVLR